MGLWGWVKNTSSKAWEGAKKVGRAIGTGVKKVGRAARPILDGIQKVAGLAEYIPGFIGDIAGSVRSGIDKANEWIDLIPEGSAKDKLKEYSSGAGELVDKGEEWLNDKGEVVRGYANRTKPYLDAADKIVDKMSGSDKAQMQKQQALRKEVELRDKYSKEARMYANS